MQVQDTPSDHHMSILHCNWALIRVWHSTLKPPPQKFTLESINLRFLLWAGVRVCWEGRVRAAAYMTNYERKCQHTHFTLRNQLPLEEAN